MKNPEYMYVDVAINGAQNRNKLSDLTMMGDPSDKALVDTYMTYFRYDSGMVEHFKSSEGKKARSVTGYKGPAYADYIPVDIDTDRLDLALQNTIQLLEVLKNHDVNQDTCKIYFSGSKGFHVLIPSELVGVIPSEDIHQRFRSFIKRLAPGVKFDSTIYDKVRIFRIPNTINSKSGKYKIRLYPFEIYNAQAHEIIEMASQPRTEWNPEEATVNETLATLYWSEEEAGHHSAPHSKGSAGGGKVKLCMHKMMEGVGEGERDNAALRVAVHLRQSGLSPNMIWSALNEWNVTNHPPLDEKDMERIYRQGLQNYEFGCQDFLLSAYCDKACLFYKGG